MVGGDERFRERSGVVSVPVAEKHTVREGIIPHFNTRERFTNSRLDREQLYPDDQTIDSEKVVMSEKKKRYQAVDKKTLELEWFLTLGHYVK